MDERHAQIREGAGLDESRLNLEFIDFLKKWSTPLLVVVAVVAIGYFLLQKRRDMKVASLAAAFTQLEAARDAGSPTGLLAVADDHRGQGAVAEMAELAAADVYLASYRAGVRPGGRVDTAGTPEDAADLLTEADRAQQLDKAAEIYQRVVNFTQGKADMVQHTIGGLYGLAAVAECRSDFDAARRHLETIETLARNADMPEQVEIAKNRIDTLGALADLPRLYVRSEIPVSASSSIPEGLVPVPNPYLNTQPTDVAPVGPDPVGPETIGPAGPEAPPELPPVVEPETGAPGATPPGEPPTEEPAPKPAEEPKADPAR